VHGFVPWTARDGDVAVVLDGAAVPYLLRPVYDSSQPSQSQSLRQQQQIRWYQLVGECFVVDDAVATCGEKMRAENSNDPKVQVPVKEVFALI